MIKKSGSRGQVWVETVTYTLIALVLIGLVLSFTKPKIEELQDKTLIEQSIQVLKELDVAIKESAEGVVGNKRKIEALLKKGTLKIDSENDTLVFNLKSRYEYSEANQEYNEGALIIYTEELGKYFPTNITLNYSGTYDIIYNGGENSKVLSNSPTPYSIFVSNKGGSPTQMNFQIS
jgi:hypothetical protein